jgi:hypothetical protein
MIQGGIAVFTLLWLTLARRPRPQAGPCPECSMPADMHHEPGCSQPCQVCRAWLRSYRRKLWVGKAVAVLGGVFVAVMLIWLFMSV